MSSGGVAIQYSWIPMLLFPFLCLFEKKSCNKQTSQELRLRVERNPPGNQHIPRRGEGKNHLQNYPLGGDILDVPCGEFLQLT